MDDLTKFAELLRAKTGADLEETKDSTDLELSREEFMHKMMREPDGQALLDLLETGEWKIVERLGLCTATMEEKGPVFRCRGGRTSSRTCASSTPSEFPEKIRTGAVLGSDRFHHGRQGMNRITSGIERCRANLADRLEKGAITEKDVEDARHRLDMEIGEYVRFQELKSIASMDGRLTLDEAMTVYGFLGETPEHFNRQPVEVKLVLTQVFEKLLR